MKQLEISEKMKWKREKSTLYIAEGKNGTFSIEESRRGGRKRFWPKYRSKNPGGKNFNMPPCGSITVAKSMVEESEYWEQEEDPVKIKQMESRPVHAFAPKKEVKRWDMNY